MILLQEMEQLLEMEQVQEMEQPQLKKKHLKKLQIFGLQILQIIQKNRMPQPLNNALKMPLIQMVQVVLHAKIHKSLILQL